MKSKANDAVLGVFIGHSQIEAVLVRVEGERAHVLGRFTRARSRQGQMVSRQALATALPGLKSADDSDFTIQVGDGKGGGSMFLDSDLGDLATTVGRGNGETTAVGSDQLPMPFAQPLKEILGECAEKGYAQPQIAICVQPPDVAYVTFMAQADEASTRKKGDAKTGRGGEAPNRKRLLEWLSDQYSAPIAKERVAFVEMSNLKSAQRYLAVIPDPREPASITIDMLRRQPATAGISAPLIDSELTLLRTLVLNAHGDLGVQDGKTTAVVRVGHDDTLVVFFEGSELRHFERLRSLTTYDSPQTVCSRVLLQQDEQKIGAVDRLFVLGDSRSEKLLDSFRSFYEETDVRPISDLLQADGLAQTDDLPHSGTVLAAGVAVRLGFGYNGDTGVNLMPEKLRKKRKAELSLAWHTLAMIVVLFATTLFFVWQYQKGQQEVRSARMEIATNPPPRALENPAFLQARVDSLQAAYTLYTRSLATLDSLLLGSDRWSRFLESTSRSTGSVPGVWITSWSPQAGQVRMSGSARSQTQIALLARRMNGSIEKSSSYEIRADGRPVRLYEFTMTVPVPVRMPYVAEYLQQVASGDLEEDVDEVRVRPEDIHFHEDLPMTAASSRGG